MGRAAAGNMKAIIAKKEDYERIALFQKSLVQENKDYNTIQSQIIKGILKHGDRVPARIKLMPYILVEENEILAFFILIRGEKPEDTLQIAFLDFKRDDMVVEHIITFARRTAQRLGVHKILAGLNIHMHYGFGILANHFEKEPHFGNSHNPSYYTEYLEKYASRGERLFDYRRKISEIRGETEDIEKSHMPKDFEVREADFRSIKRSAYLYSEIGKRAYRTNPYYAAATPEEAEQLFEGLKYLLKNENLLFVFYKGKPAGYLLWYPDFNELLSSGEKLGIGSLLRYRFNSKVIKTVKIADIAILPKFRGSAAAYSLLSYLCKMNFERYLYITSSPVLESNTMGMRIAERFLKNRNNTYKILEIDL